MSDEYLASLRLSHRYAPSLFAWPELKGLVQRVCHESVQSSGDKVSRRCDYATFALCDVATQTMRMTHLVCALMRAQLSRTRQRAAGFSKA